MTFWPAQVRRQRNLPIVFCHVEGQEESSVISTSESNEESKRNMKEVRKAVCEHLSYDINSVIITVVCIKSRAQVSDGHHYTERDLSARLLFAEPVGKRIAAGLGLGRSAARYVTGRAVLPRKDRVCS